MDEASGRGREGALDAQREGESGREFRREATRIHCKEREGRKRKSVFMEECDCVQCMRDGTD